MSFKRNEAGKRLSLDSFKAQADAASTEVSVEKITGGTLSGCHGGGMIASKLSLSSISLSSVSVSALRF